MTGMEEFHKKIVHERVFPKREAVFTPFPDRMLPGLRDFLERSGISMLYSHQGEMFDRAMDGENVIVTTSTASGKTLGFLLPVLQEILVNPASRAIFLYPTKALASDQFRSFVPLLAYFGPSRLQAGVYDGDTPSAERGRIRSSANIVLTNPEMLNATFLPNHGSYGFSFFFANLKYIVVDELHSYRGAFGSHLANVMKRLGRICRYYGSSPRFLCSSATIANPVELAENICGRPFSHVSRDGFPVAGKALLPLAAPHRPGDGVPRLPGPGSYGASRPARPGKLALPGLLQIPERRGGCPEGSPGQAEGRSPGVRGRDMASLVSGYRGGYRPWSGGTSRRKWRGQLRGLVATNVLELGIDIGRIDTAVLVGFPGTRLPSGSRPDGRGGREGARRWSCCWTIFPGPVSRHRSGVALLGRKRKRGGGPGQPLHPGGPRAGRGGRTAPLRGRRGPFPGPRGDRARPPSRKGAPEGAGKVLLVRRGLPGGDISLRTWTGPGTSSGMPPTDPSHGDGRTPGLPGDLPGRHLPPRGLQYLVESLDLNHTEALARPTEGNYYTVSCDMTEVHKIRDEKTEPLGRTLCGLGDVRVAYTTVGFRRQQFHNHQNLGMEMLDRPLGKSFDTEGFWIALPGEVRRLFLSLAPAPMPGFQFRKTYAEGLSFALLNTAMMAAMATPEDMGSALLAGDGPEGGRMSVCVFDMYAGGLGFSRKGFSLVRDILRRADRMIRGCPCRGGCPACVGDYHLDKRVVLWAIGSLSRPFRLPGMAVGGRR